MGRSIPETSKAAFDSLDPTKIAEIHRKILWALSQLGDATFEDVAAFLHIEKGRIWRRLSELHKQGLIYRPGIKKALRSGRAAFCWQLTDASLPKTTTQEKALKGPSVSEYSRKINAIAKSVPLQLF